MVYISTHNGCMYVAPVSIMLFREDSLRRFALKSPMFVSCLLVFAVGFILLAVIFTREMYVKVVIHITNSNAFGI